MHDPHADHASFAFDDDPGTTSPDASLVHRSRAPRPRTPRERAVHRLLGQVESLRLRLAGEKRRLDEALIFQAAHISPKQARLTVLRTEAVRALAGFLDDRRLGMADSRVLCEILIEQLDEILAHTAAPDPDLKELFARLHGVGFDDVVQEGLEEARSGMAAILSELGFDMEIPELRPDMSEEEMAATAAQMRDRIRQVEEASGEKGPVRRKTKREQREAERAQRFEQMRKISIGAIYKRLVKALHPDLERDPSVRELKSALMQQITAAYAGNDLHTLLRLELEWIDGNGPAAARRTDETLDGYAQLLRQQVTQLRTECMDLPFHPRYESLLAGDNPFGAYLIDGPVEVERLDAAIEGLSAALGRLVDKREGLGEVRALLQAHRQEGSRATSHARRGRRKR